MGDIMNRVDDERRLREKVEKWAADMFSGFNNNYRVWNEDPLRFAIKVLEEKLEEIIKRK